MVGQASVLQIRRISKHELGDRQIAERVVEAFHQAKPDSIICRMPKTLLKPYIESVLEEGIILTALVDNRYVAFLVFVADNNLSIDYLRKHKLAVGWQLLSSPSWKDKKILVEMVISYILMLGKPLPEEFQDEISLLAVATGYQGRGIGAELIKTLRKEGPTRVRVKTEVTNTGAIRFYEKNGFKPVGSITAGLRRMVAFEQDG